MRARARFLGHSIHQMLIVIPAGLLTTSLIFDLIGAVRGDLEFLRVSLYMIGAGIVGGLFAAIFGVADLLQVPRQTRAMRVGLLHAGANIIMLALFALSFVLRLRNEGIPNTTALSLSVAAFGLLAIAGWLGGELVDRLGLGVDDGAHLNAPSSLRTDSARGHAETPSPANPLSLR